MFMILNLTYCGCILTTWSIAQIRSLFTTKSHTNNNSVPVKFLSTIGLLDKFMKCMEKIIVRVINCSIFYTPSEP